MEKYTGEYESYIIRALEEELGDNFETFEVRAALNIINIDKDKDIRKDETEINQVLKQLDIDGYLKCESRYPEETIYQKVKDGKNYSWRKTDDYEELLE